MCLGLGLPAPREGELGEQLPIHKILLKIGYILPLDSHLCSYLLIFVIKYIRNGHFWSFQVVKNGSPKIKILHSLIIIDSCNEFYKYHIGPKDKSDGYQVL